MDKVVDAEGDFLQELSRTNVLVMCWVKQLFVSDTKRTQ